MLISDPTIEMAHAALNGLAVRRQQIATNLAHIATPGFQALRVEFESALQDATGHTKGPGPSFGPGAHLPTKDFGLPRMWGHTSEPIATLPTGDPDKADGNNVMPDAELIALTDTDLKQAIMADVIVRRVGILRSVIKG